MNKTKFYQNVYAPLYGISDSKNTFHKFMTMGFCIVRIGLIKCFGRNSVVLFARKYFPNWITNLKIQFILHDKAKINHYIGQDLFLREIIVEDCYDLCMLKKTGLIIDVGANVGAFSILAARKADQVYASNQKNFEVLQKKSN